MKKLISVLVLLLVLAGAYAGASWYVGKRAETMVTQLVEQGNARLAGQLGPDLAAMQPRIVIDDYQRGVFTSQARYAFEFLTAEGDRRRILLGDRMQHGPFPWDALKSGSFAPLMVLSHTVLLPGDAVTPWFEAVGADGAQPLLATTRIGFNGQGEGQWRFAPARLNTPQTQLSFSGAVVDLAFTGGLQSSQVSGGFALLDVIRPGEQESTRIEDLRFLGRSASPQDGQIQWHSAVEVGRLQLGEAGEPLLTAHDAALRVDSRQQGKLLDGELRYDFGRVLVADLDFGGFSLGGKVERLDSSALWALARDYEALLSERGLSLEDPPPLDAEALQRLQGSLNAVLQSKPSLALGPLVWRNQGGESRASLSAALAPGDTTEPLRLLEQVLQRVDLSVSLSRPMLEEVLGKLYTDQPEQGAQARQVALDLYDQSVAQLSRAGLVRADGKSAQADIGYAGGMFRVNGNQLPLAQLLQLFMLLAL